MSATCLWCRKELRFVIGHGWVHADTGTIYITRVDADGVERDDHCALPIADTVRCTSTSDAAPAA